jgi:type III secretion protein V
VAASSGLSTGADALARLGATLSRSADAALALLAVLVIALMVLPLPPWLLDALIAVNIASGVLLLLFSLYVATPLAFSTFPSVLLFTTLFRIALNVATTRQVLLAGHAGDIIDAFGRIVVGGSLIVGLVVFFIITIVQFVVIAKGAERVAEVGARFTLDALPGKQMAIDSDLRAGLISAADAMRMREKLGLESQFFGAMDGAMKFVKGDAAASIVIVLANLLGGLAVGVLVFGLPLADAITKYSVLAIGDGLVTQIPALFIAMAAGVVVTRTSPEQGEAVNLATQIGAQVSTQPRALLLGGAVIAMFALAPGFPATPFLAVGATVAFVGYRNARRLLRGAQAMTADRVAAAARDGDATPERVLPHDRAPFAQLAIEFNEALLARTSLADFNSGLLQLRTALRVDRGLPFPGLGLRRSTRPQADEFWILLREVPLRRVSCPLGQAPQEVAARAVGELQSVLHEHAAELIGVQETRQLVAQVERRYPDLVREANALLPLPRMAELLQQLTAEGVPVRDVRGILEAVVQHASPNVTFRALVNWVRRAVARDICHSLSGPGGELLVVTLPLASQQQLRDAIQLDEQGDRQLIVNPEDAMRFAEDLHALCLPDAAGGAAVLLVPPDLRWALRRLLEPHRVGIRVVSHDEVTAGARITVRAELSWHDSQMALLGAAA